MLSLIGKSERGLLSFKELAG